MDERKIDRQIAEKVFSMNLSAFGIFSKEGMRLRERDFESREDAQRYIDSEDERKAEIHKAGVKIEPCVRRHPEYSTDPAASKQLREKLAEKWDSTLGHANNHCFALWPKGTIDKYSQPTHLATSDTEELAVALCALKAVGRVG